MIPVQLEHRGSRTRTGHRDHLETLEVTAAWLVDRRRSEHNLRVVDVSSRLDGVDPGYLPYASRLDWESQFGSPPTVCPNPLVLAAVMSQLGIGDEDTPAFFVLANRSASDVGSALAAAGIAVRAGHHCAQPALRRFGLEATVRPSFALYNNRDDIDALVAVVRDLAQTTPH